jgi:FUS-interacting serine-arginine-rich protein 1
MPRSFGPSNRSLFIRNVAEVTRSEDLRNLFAEFGHVSDVYIPHDYYNHRPRGFAYVQFDDVRAAEESVHHLDRVRLFGRELEVEFAQGDRKTPSEMRGRERGTVYRSGGPSNRRSYRSTRNERRRRSRSRSRDRNHKQHRSRHHSRSRSRSPHRSHRHHRHNKDSRHSHSRSRSKSHSKSGKNQELKHHSKSKRNDKELNELKDELENHTNRILNKTDIESDNRKDGDIPNSAQSTNTTPSSIERTNGDKQSFGEDSKEGSIEDSFQT